METNEIMLENEPLSFVEKMKFKIASILHPSHQNVNVDTDDEDIMI